MSKRAIAYIRVSTDRQELSPTAQREQVEAYCNFKGFELVALMDETGVSGTTPFAQRKRGGDLLASLGDCDAVVFSKLDRAFRDTVDCIATVERIRAAGKSVHFIDLGIDTSTAMGQAFMEMSAVFAKLEWRRISDRTRECLQSAARAGKRLGGVPFGLRTKARFEDGRKVDGGVYVPVPEEQAVIERIRALRGGPRPKPYREIARILRDENVPTRRGGTWQSEQVRRIARRDA